MEWSRDGSAKKYANKESRYENLRVDILSYICFQAVMDFMKDVGMSTRKLSSLLSLFAYFLARFHPYFIPQFL